VSSGDALDDRLEIASLLEAAREAREHAYAPYSGFRVGAAVRSTSGQVFRGCNIENASYGLANCAERTALFCAIAAGCRPGDLTYLAVIADTEGPVSPCGACRQVMIELGGLGLVVIRANLRGEIARSSAQELLPGAFVLERHTPR
jgi:cytidine deaminase